MLGTKQLESSTPRSASSHDTQTTAGKSTLTSQLADEPQAATPEWEPIHPFEIADIQREPGLLAYLDSAPEGAAPAEHELARSAPELDGDAHEVDHAAHVD